MEQVSNLNRLYDGYKKSSKNSKWKPEVQKFEMNWLSELAKLNHEIEDKTYTISQGSEFIINERGKVRYIVGHRMRDRVIGHSFCDNVLEPAVNKFLIFDNGASQKGKGISFTRDRLLQHLRNYYHHNGNDGYILLIDFSKYYDNILHREIRRAFKDKLNDDEKWLMDVILMSFEVDVSYMTEEEYANCERMKYSSLDAPRCHDGLKFMEKSVDIGDQASQIIGIFHPTPIDNYVKIVRSQKYYGRYMDDSYIIAKTKEELESILDGIKAKASEIGIFINEKKTKIVKLSDGFRFLQNKYILTETGCVIIKMNPDRLVAMRRKMKKLTDKIIHGALPVDVLSQLFDSWYGNYYKSMSKAQRKNFECLYKELLQEIRQWIVKSRLQMAQL